jgi:hypothetical protein
MDETPLFENLADQSTPERPRGQPRFQVPQRDAIERRVVDLDGLVAADDPVRVNYRTPSDFRVDNEDLLNRRPSRSVAVLVKEGLVHLDRLSLDGLRVRAWACSPRACPVAAGAASFRRGESLQKCLEQSLPRRRPGPAPAKAGGEPGRPGDLQDSTCKIGSMHQRRSVPAPAASARCARRGQGEPSFCGMRRPTTSGAPGPCAVPPQRRPRREKPPVRRPQAAPERRASRPRLAAWRSLKHPSTAATLAKRPNR